MVNPTPNSRLWNFAKLPFQNCSPGVPIPAPVEGGAARWYVFGQKVYCPKNCVEDGVGNHSVDRQRI